MICYVYCYATKKSNIILPFIFTFRPHANNFLLNHAPCETHLTLIDAKHFFINACDSYIYTKKILNMHLNHHNNNHETKKKFNNNNLLYNFIYITSDFITKN